MRVVVNQVILVPPLVMSPGACDAFVRSFTDVEHTWPEFLKFRERRNYITTSSPTNCLLAAHPEALSSNKHSVHVVFLLLRWVTGYDSQRRAPETCHWHKNSQKLVSSK